MLKEILKQNRWFRFYTYFFLFNAIGGFFMAYDLVSGSPYLAFMAVLIFMGIFGYFIVWLIWFLVLTSKRNVRSNENALTSSEGVANNDVKGVRRKLIFSTILWLFFLLVLSWYIFTLSPYKSTAKHEDSLALLSVVFISWPIFLLSIKYKLSKISDVGPLSKEMVFRYAHKYSLIVSLGIPVLLFSRELAVLFSYLFFVILMKLG